MTKRELDFGIEKKNKLYRRWGKRFFDLLLTITLLILLSPLMAIIAVLIWIKMGKPVFFCHKRPGLHGKPFVLYKFRTMTVESNDLGEALPESERLTSLCRFLRRFSLDELPELINVIKGNMSLVGPRPLLIDYLPYYSKDQHKRHEVLPGITGWAQIHGRNECLFSRRLNFDIWYTEHLSFHLDVKILIISVLDIIKGRGVRSDMEQCLLEVDDLGLSRRIQRSDSIGKKN